MVVNTASLVGTSLVTMPLGFVYWWLGAHRFPTDSVGVASAGVSAMMLLATISVLGFGTLLIGELPRQPQKKRELIATAVATAGTVGFLLGFGFALLAPTISAHLAPLGQNQWAALLFAAGVALTTVTLVLDAVMIGVLRGAIQFWRNATLGVSKLALLWLIASATAWRSGLAIYGSWAAGVLVSIGFLALAYVRRGGTAIGWRPDWSLLRSLRKLALWHHGVNLGLQAPVFALPVLATALISRTSGAHFYVAWMIAGLVFVVPLSLSTVLFAMSAAEPASLRGRMRQTVSHSVAIAVPAVCLLVLVAPWLLRLFGKAYASEASTMLRILVLAVFPLIVRNHYIAVARVLGLLRRAAQLVAATAVLELTAAIAGGVSAGILGLTLAWVAAAYLEGLVMAPLVYTVSMGQFPVGSVPSSTR